MRGRIFLGLLFALVAAEGLLADELLDAKLNALKKKVQRRNYSETALLDEQNLTVPKALTEEEKELDAKIRAMEKELDTDPSMMSRQTARPRRVRRVDPDASANWLTPELLNHLSDRDPAPDEQAEGSWVQAELARQESLRQEKLTQEEEQRLIDERVQEKMRRDTTSSFTPANDYNESLQSIISGRAPAEENAEESAPRRSLYNRFLRGTPSSQTEKRSGSSSSLFTFPQSEASGTEQKESSSFLQRQELTPGFTRSPSSGIARKKAEEKEQEPIRRRIRPSSRSRDENPFEREWVPDMKTSIWD